MANRPKKDWEDFSTPSSDLAKLRKPPSSIIFSGLLVFSFLLVARGWGNLDEVGVRALKIPGFDNSGRISWELEAKEVNFQKDGVYEAFDLVLRTLTGFNRSNARSRQGIFQPKEGKAWGESVLEVEGSGYLAEGKRWLWKNEIEDGEQLMAFQENGKVLFEDDLLIERNTESRGSIDENQSDSEAVEKKKLFKTLAQAEYIEVLELSPIQNRFLLKKKVEVRSIDLNISCDSMEIFFDKDSNRTKNSKSLGRISRIVAIGNVQMFQDGRNSFADGLRIDVISGEAVLSGNARVEDEDYGVAKGNEIILERGKRRAKIVGTDEERPSLQLPEIPDFGFPKR